MDDGSILVRQYVEFVAKGLDEVSLLTDEYRRRLDQADSAAALLAKTLASGAYEDIARRTHAAAMNMQALTARAREVEYAVRGGLDAEVAEKFRSKLEETTHQADLLQRALGSGAYASYAAKIAEQTRRLEGLKAQAQAIDNATNGYRPAARLGTAIAIAGRAPTQEMRWADEYRQKITAANQAAEKSAFMARMQYGALGSSLIHAGDQVTSLSRRFDLLSAVGSRTWAILAGGGSLAVAGLASQGFAGTVEMHQFLFSIQLIGREVAGLFVPAIRAATEWLQRVGAYLRSLSGDQQEQIRKWGLMAAGAALFAMTLPRIVSVGGQALTMLGKLGPMLGTIAPGLASAAAAAGPWGIAIAAGLAVAAAGFVVAYARSAEFRAEVTKAAQQFYELYKSAKPFVDLALDLHIRSITLELKVLIEQLKLAGMAFQFLDKSTFGFGTGGIMGVMAHLREQFPETKARADRMMGMGGESGRKKDDVTIMQTGFESLQSTFDRMQEAVLRAESGAGDPVKDTAKATKDTADNTKQIADFLNGISPSSILGNIGPSIFGRRGEES